MRYLYITILLLLANILHSQQAFLWIGTPPIPPTFTTTWTTNNVGDSNDHQISLPLISSGNYNFVVNWGDGQDNVITAWDQPERTHTYTLQGSYEVTITGTLEGWAFNDGGDKLKLTHVSEWGPLVMSNSSDFQGCANMTISASDSLILSGDLRNCFRETGITSIDVSNWDISAVTVMHAFFFGNSNMVDIIGEENWGNTFPSDMSFMFQGCPAIDSLNIKDWDVSRPINLTNFLFGSSINRNNYDDILISWAAQDAYDNVTAHFGNSVYTNNSPGADGRQSLVDIDFWTITDGGGVDVFVSTWVTNNTGTSNDNQITLPLISSGTYNFVVEWGDGTSDTITTWNQPEVTHTYPFQGTYEVGLLDTIIGFDFDEGGDRLKLTEISIWGNDNLTINSQGAFKNCSNLIVTASDKLTVTGIAGQEIFRGCVSIDTLDLRNWDLAGCTTLYQAFNGMSGLQAFLATGLNSGSVTSLYDAFSNCTNLSTLEVANMDVSSVTSFNTAFYNCDALSNVDLSTWNVSSATNMGLMFNLCIGLDTLFTSGWVTTSLTNISAMFSGCTSLTHVDGIAGWNVGGVTNMGSTFYNCTSLTSLDIGAWNLVSANTLGYMFYACSSLDSLDVSTWNVSNVTDMQFLFSGCSSVDSLDVSSWNTSSLTLLRDLFSSCSSLTYLDLNGWNVSAVSSFRGMFKSCTNLATLNIASWNLSTVNELHETFAFCSSLTYVDVSSWNVSTLTSLYGAFWGCSSISGLDVSAWNTSSLTNISDAFRLCASLDTLGLQYWDISNITGATRMLQSVNIGTYNYNQILTAWDAQSVQNNVLVDFGTSTYTDSSAAMVARYNLVNDHAWTITDGGGIAAYTTVWKTDNPGVSGSNQIALPLTSSGTYNFIVDWGDDSIDTITAWNQAEATHTYASPGIYQVAITDTLQGWYFNNGGDGDKLLDVVSWDNLIMGWAGAFGRYFAGCDNMDVTAADVPDLSTFVAGDYIFERCYSLVGTPAFEKWDVSNFVSTMGFFWDCNSFNQDVGGWDLSNSSNIAQFFYGCDIFDQDVGGWDVSNIIYSAQIFRAASSFNNGGSASIGSWNTSGWTTLALIFNSAGSFNQDISGWDVSNITTMEGAFNGATAFNQDLNSWNTASLTNTKDAFYNAASLQYPPTSWNMSGVTTTYRMFYGCTSLTSIDGSAWDVSNVTTMYQMFKNCTNLDTLIADSWNVSLVTNMAYMFESCNSLTEIDISSWDIDQVTDFTDFMEFVTLPTLTYDNILTGWEAQNVQNNITIHFGNSQYSDNSLASEARQRLINDHTWTITDGGTISSFRFAIDTENPGTSGNNQFHLGLSSGGTFNFTVDWGDGSSDVITVWNQAETLHTYASPGEYMVSMNGTYDSWTSSVNGDEDKITTVLRWGDFILGSSDFSGCDSLKTIIAIDSLNCASLIGSAFQNALYLRRIDNMERWKFSNVTDMNRIFSDAKRLHVDSTNFNALDVSNITTIYLSFFRAFQLSGSDTLNLSNWNTSSLQNMREAFVQNGLEYIDVSGWDVSNVTNMWSAFQYNGNIGHFEVGAWDVSNVTNMNSIFHSCSNLTTIDVSSWNVGNVTDMGGMFYDCSSLDTVGIDNWNISGVANISSMFYNCSSLTSLDVSGWNTSSATNMSSTFDGCSLLDTLGIYNWDVSGVTDLTNFLRGVTLPVGDYNQVLLNWEGQLVQNNVPAHFGNSMYSNSSLASDARQRLIDDHTWTITDGGGITAFITEWVTSNTGVSNNDQITLPLRSGNTYNFIVDWGDASLDTITVWNQAETTHTYASPGLYEVIITDTINGLHFAFGGDKGKIIDVVQWGPYLPSNAGQDFYGCTNMDVTASDTLDLTGITDLSYFLASTNLVGNASIAGWDVSAVTALNDLFRNTQFNQDISGWNVGLCTNFSRMFNGNGAFNQNISGWDVSSATNLNSMFGGCSSFNQKLANWNTSSVTNISSMFAGCSSLDSLDVSTWNTSSATNMTSMFTGCTSLDTIDVSSWDVSLVQTMNDMFYQCSALIALDVSGWNVGSVTRTDRMFYNCALLDTLGVDSWNMALNTTTEQMFQNCSGLDSLDLSAWNVSNVSNMQEMFANASSLNSVNVSNWNTASLEDAQQMFLGCSSLTSLDVGGWDMDTVTVMLGMFQDCSSLTALDVSSWDISSATNLNAAFLNCSSLDTIGVGNWNLTGVTDLASMFKGCSSLDSVNVSSWDVSTVTNFSSVFEGCTSLQNLNVYSWDVTAATSLFTQMFKSCSLIDTLGIYNWDISNATNMINLLESSTLDTSNYDQILIAWEAQLVQNNVSVHFGNSVYNISVAGTARTNLINDHSWTITDGGGVYLYDSISVNANYDVEEQASNSGIYELTSSDLEINSEDNTSAADSQTVVIEWVNLAIPAGAIIDSAFIVFTIDTQTGTAGADVEIWGVDSASPTSLATTSATAYYYTDAWWGGQSESPTTATVSWDNLDITEATLGVAVGDPFPTPDIKTIIQEIVDLPGWVQSTSDIILVIQPLAGTDDIGECEFEACDGTACPILKVYYHY